MTAAIQHSLDRKLRAEFDKSVDLMSRILAFVPGSALGELEEQLSRRVSRCRALQSLMPTPSPADAQICAHPGTAPGKQEAGQMPIETIRYWVEAYSNPESGEHFMGHGMAVAIMREYMELRESTMADRPQAAPFAQSERQR